MRVRTYGKNDKIEKKEIRSVVKYMAGLLMSGRLCKNLTIHVHSIHKLENFGDPCRGAMYYIGKRPPREFKVFVDSSMGKREQLLALAHELVHVKHYALEQVVELANGDVKWMNEIADPDIPYYFESWEIEAHGLERGLLEYYKGWKRELRTKRK